MKLTQTRLAGLLLLAFCLGYYALIGQIRLLPFQMNDAFTARTLPTVLSALGIIFSLVLVVFPGDTKGLELRGTQWRVVLTFLALMFVYGLVLKFLGFILSTSAFLMIGYALLGERKPMTLFFTSVPVVLAFWAMMTMGLDVYIDPLPSFL